MSRYFPFVFTIVVVSCVNPRPATAQENAGLRAVADMYWDLTMERYPMRATEIGDYRFNDRLDDVTDRARLRWRNKLNNTLRELRVLNAAALSEEDRFTKKLLERAIRDDILRLSCMKHMMPLDPLNGIHIQFPLLLTSQPFRNEKDFRDYISRLRAFPRLVTNTITNMRKAASTDIVSPRVLVEKIIPQVRTHIVRNVRSSEFFKPASDLTKLPTDVRPAIENEITGAIESEVIPAYLQLLAFLEDEYLPACRDTVGIGALRGGDKVYDALAYLNTTVHLSVSEIHELGLSEVNRIRGEMALVQDQIGFDGSLDEFLKHMRTDAKYRFNSPEELVSAADHFLQRTKPLLPKLFGKLPEADCVMKEIEAFRAKSSPVAYYNPTPEDGSRPGYYYINTYAPQERLRFTLEALTYHEAVPGHHLQFALDRENKNIPKFRRHGNFTAYVEGWALYTEKLGYEIGGYRTPELRFGQLTFEMWRACRLVVDTGMHVMDWTRQQAIDYMEKNTSLALLDINSEVDRYISWPGQALAYKIGELRILEMRRTAEEALGNRFDLRSFHDAMLQEGAMPIDMLEKRMNKWIEMQ